MRELEVFLNVGEHPIYNTLVKFPPKKVKYLGLRKRKSESKLTIYERKKNIFRKAITKFTSAFRIPRMFIFKTNAELIHTSRGIIPLNKKPWVMDIEHAKSFFDDHKVLYSERARRIVKKFLFSPSCKKIMPHCNIASKSLLFHFGKELKEKIEVVYPAIEARYHNPNRNSEKIKILFIANKFFEKGGLEVLQTFKELEKKYDVELIFKCKLPREFKVKFDSPNIVWLEKNFSYQELFKKVYSKANIFVFPSYIDTFGYSLLEAMSVGLPIVATNIFAIPEIIEDGKNGFLVDASKYSWSNVDGVMKPKFILNPEIRMKMYEKAKPEIVSQLLHKISLLIENSSLRTKMGRYGRSLIEKGKFSIKERNKKLRRIYEEATRH